MTKVEKYLYKRIDSLSEEKVVLITKINKITIEIEEVEGMIDEISAELDTAFEMFSPKPKKNDFNRKEIDRLMIRKEELNSLRDEFVKQCMVVEEDIAEIRESLGEEYDEEMLYDVNDEKNSTEDISYALKVIEEQEKEKQQLATRINDSTVSIINNMIYKCDMCTRIIDVDATRAKLELEILTKELKDMQDNIKNIVFQLKPADYSDVNLKTSLERMINLTKLNTDMMVNLNISDSYYKLSPVIEMTCIRIIQEALENSLKYSEGKNLNLNIIYEENMLRIEVVDDGKGIDFNNTISDNGEINTLGLSIMRERAYLLGGSVQISSDSTGTKIVVYIPYGE